MNIGENIRRRREQLGLSQEALAEKLNTSRQTIYNWENEYTSPDASSIKSLCDALNCDVNYLFDEFPNDTIKVSYNDSKGESSEIFSSVKGTVKRHWRKVYIYFFYLAFGNAFLGIFSLLGIKMMSEFAASSPIHDSSIDASMNSGLGVFRIISMSFFAIAGLMFIIGLILLIKDRIYQKNYNEE